MNYLDYIKEKGNLNFKEYPINIVDYMIFCQLIYVPFEKIIDIERKIKLVDLAAYYYTIFPSKKLEEEINNTEISLILLEEVAKCKRYKDVVVHHFYSYLNNENFAQFAVCQMDISPFLTCVVFRGTDDNIAGWKEDFKITYEITGGQLKAKEYVNNYLSSFRRFVYAGHSKGGNNALFAALNSSWFIRKRIIKVYSYDGPGLHSDFVNEKIWVEIKEKFIKVVPEYDIFGTILEHCKNKLVVKTDKDGLDAHSMASWQLNNLYDLDLVTKTLKVSDKLREGLFKFMDDVPIEERKEFFETMFKIPDEMKLTKLSELKKTKLINIVKALRFLLKMDSTNKRIGGQILRLLLDARNAQ